MKTFRSLFSTTLAPQLVSELHGMGIVHTVPVQEAAIPVLLDGRDAIIVSPTGAFGFIVSSRTRMLTHVHTFPPTPSLTLCPILSQALARHLHTWHQ